MGGRGTSSKDGYTKKKGTLSLGMNSISENEADDLPVAGTKATHEFDLDNGPPRIFNNEREAEQLPNFSPEMRDDLRKYTFQGDEAVNGYLRYGNEPRKVYANVAEVNAAIANLDRAMGTTSTPDSIRVFRGGSASMSEGLKKGDIITDKGYPSTSLIPKVARDYALDNASPATPGSKIDKTVFMIHVPKGARGIHIAKQTSDFPTEREFLLHRNPKFRVDGVKEQVSSGTRYVALTLASK